MRDYDACARLGEAIHPGAYQVAICSAFKGAKQQEAIIAKVPAQASSSVFGTANTHMRPNETEISHCRVSWQTH